MKKLIFIAIVLIAVWGVYLVNTNQHPFQDAGAIPDHQQWYSLKWHGNNVGYVKQTWSRHKDYYQWTQLLQIEGMARGKPFRRVSEEALQFSLDFPYPLVSGSWFVDHIQQQKYDFVVNSQMLEIHQDGKIKSLDYPQTWDAQQLWMPQRVSLLAHQPGQNKTLQILRWDMQQMQPVSYEFTFGKVNLAGEIQAISQKSNSVSSDLWLFNGSGKLVSRSMGTALQLVEASESEALKISSVDAYQNTLLSVDKPLGAVQDIAELELEFGELWQFQNPAKRVKITQESSGGFLQIGMPGEYETQLKQVFLEQNDRYLDSPRINRIAQSLTQGKITSFQKAEAIMEFVSEFIEDSDEINEVTVTHILDNAKGDCTEHALLFVTLARAAGIPSREANGLLYLGDSQQKYSAHVWAEVEIDGHWLSIDPTWRKMGLDPGYIRVYGHEASTKATLLALSGKTIHVKALSF